MRVRAAFADQAISCAALGSPFTSRLLSLAGERLTRDTALGAHILDWPDDPTSRASSLPLRFAGALHRLALSGEALRDIWPPATPPASDDGLWHRIFGAMDAYRDTLSAWMGSPPQTNEVRRSSAILPALHLLAAHAARPLSLYELGASAGLNLICDRYTLVAGDTLYPARDPLLRLSPEWSGIAPPAAPDLRVAQRKGVDLNPLDAGDCDDRLRLMSYIWPDQPERMGWTRLALEAGPPPPDRGDAGDWLTRHLPTAPVETLPVVYHTVAWQYFSDTTRERASRAMSDFGAHRPLARLSMEADGDPRGAALELTLWPGPRRIALGRADFHGRWVDWRGPSSLG